jgi:hypothetical protein
MLIPFESLAISRRLIPLEKNDSQDKLRDGSKVRDHNDWDDHLPPILNSRTFWFGFIAATIPLVFIYVIVTEFWEAGWRSSRAGHEGAYGRGGPIDDGRKLPST